MSVRRVHAERGRRPRHGPLHSGPWRRATVIVAAIAGLSLSVAPSEAHAGGLDVLRNCAANGQLGKAFARGDLERALERMPADLAEYSDCDEQIASQLRAMAHADRMGAAVRARDADDRDGDAGDSGGGAAGGGAGGATAGRDGPAGPRPGDAEAGDPDQGVGGALLSGAEAVGAAPLDVVEAAAEGRLGVPGWVWPLLGVAALLGLGVWRERRA